MAGKGTCPTCTRRYRRSARMKLLFTGTPTRDEEVEGNGGFRYRFTKGKRIKVLLASQHKEDYAGRVWPDYYNEYSCGPWISLTDYVQVIGRIKSICGEVKPIVIPNESGRFVHLAEELTEDEP